MSRGQSELDRAAILTALNDEAGRKSSTATILYQLAIADRLGLSLTDLVSGEILSRTGAITAGELAELSGLTTGAITGVVDRLEKAGFVRRVNDPNDRRRVMLEPVSARFDTLSGDPYAALEERFNALYADYDDEELGLLLEFLRKSINIFDEETVRLREQTTPRNKTAERGQGMMSKPHIEPNLARMIAQADIQANIQRGPEDEALFQIRQGGQRERRVFAAPRGDFELARLKWDSGPVKLSLSGNKGLSELYRAEFRHDIPIVRYNDGNISVQYRHRTLFGRGGGNADVELNAQIPWAIYFECGASHIDADLSHLLLKSFWLKSKATRLVLKLPPPKGIVQIHLESGLSNLRIERPRHVPVRMEFEGDWAQLRFDGKKMQLGSEVLETPDYKRGTDRYLIEFVGGGSKIVVE